jgi:hypothetical protein
MAHDETVANPIRKVSNEPVVDIAGKLRDRPLRVKIARSAATAICRCLSTAHPCGVCLRPEHDSKILRDKRPD